MQPISFADALRALRDRWWVLVAAALIGALAAYGATRLPWAEPRWRSSVWLQAEGRFDYGSALALEKQLRPLAERVRQLTIMREVNRNLRLDLPPEQMLANTRAEPVLDSLQLRIDVDDAYGPRAEAIALEMANVYSQQHNARQEGTLREERVLLTVLDRASTPTLVWPQTRTLVPAAALLALAAATGVVLLLALLDDTLKSAEDVHRVLGFPVLGLVPGPARNHRRRAGGADSPYTSASLDRSNPSPMSSAVATATQPPRSASGG